MPTDIREMILAELVRKGHSHYWMAMRAKNTCAECGHIPKEKTVEFSERSPNGVRGPKDANARLFQCHKCGHTKPVADSSTVHRYLRGARDTSSKVIAFMLDLLGMKIKRS